MLPLRSGYALPARHHGIGKTGVSTGRQATHRNRNAVARNRASSETVNRLSPDLVVIGTRAHGAIGRLLLGSTAEEALRTLNCDVLAVPSTAE